MHLMGIIRSLPTPHDDGIDALVQAIAQTHTHFVERAFRAVDLGLTFRNWCIGCHVQEFEQGGAERAEYGERIFEELSVRLKRDRGIEYHPREIRRCRQFYNAYPQIRGTLSPESSALLPRPSVRARRRARVAVPAVSVERLVRALCYSHFVELLEIEGPVKRAFYEAEIVRGNWSVRELRRQVGALLYERASISRNKKKVVDVARHGAESMTPAQAIRDPYVFEFLGLKPREAVRERDLEELLLDRLQYFLLELGRGFCFEARQKRIPIGDELFFVDLVFYHRILRCHVLIELKSGKFRHEHLGQLNTYVNWYRKHEMTPQDNPPIGLLLCTGKNHALMEYALAGLDNQLFVSRYQLELPGKAELEQFLREQVKDHISECRAKA